MKVFYDYANDEILTEKEARKNIKKNIKEEIVDNDYALWEFITDNYYYEAIMKNLSQDFLENIIEELIENRLENSEYFLTKEISD